MANSADLTDLDLHCLQRQGISGFSRQGLRIKVLKALVGRLSLSVDLRLFHLTLSLLLFKQAVQMLIRCCQCSSPGYPLYSDKNCAAINNRYWDFVQMQFDFIGQ